MAGERFEKQDCIRGKLTKALGLEACGEISFPKATGSTPWFPFTGPARASLVLNKKDTFSKYEFEAKYVKTKVCCGTTVILVCCQALSLPILLTN